MIIITSLSPNHSNKSQQHIALESWQPYGNIFSMNKEEEIKILNAEDYKGVHFVPTIKTIEHLINKPLVTISSMIDMARSQYKDLLIINSDIEIENMPELRDDGITLFSRWDYSDLHQKVNARMFIYGFDMFYIPKQFLKVFPQSLFALGAAWWDLAIPYHAILKNIPIYYPIGKFCYHKIHKTQYSTDEWFFLGNHFKWFFKVENRFTVEQTATNIMNIIRSKFRQGT